MLDIERRNMNKLEIIIGGHTFFEGAVTSLVTETHIDGWITLHAEFPAVEVGA